VPKAINNVVSRRNFVRNAALGAILIVLGQLGAGFVRFFWPNKIGAFGSVLTVPASDVPAAGTQPFTYTPGKFYLVHLDQGLMALYWKCTHLGCTVPWVASEDRFHCPCHGSIFFENGVKESGPAPRPLDYFPITVTPTAMCRSIPESNLAERLRPVPDGRIPVIRGRSITPFRPPGPVAADERKENERVGSVQRMATVVAVGLVAMSTVLFLYLGDENNRIETEAAEQQASAIERARTNFISLCLSCHGPAGEGFTEPGVQGTGRIGAALGGINTSLNQQGINSQGTPVAGGVAGREAIIRNTITNGLKNPDGSYRMPPFSDANGGPLNDEQINQLVLLIQHGDWNETYNAAVEASGGYPTPPPAPAAGATQTAQAEAGAAPAAPTTAPTGDGAAAAQEVTITMHDIYFDPAEVTIPANTPVTVKLPNQGAALHDFTIDALGINVQVNPGRYG